MDALNIGDDNSRNLLMKEVITISKILGSITSKVDRKLKGK